MLTSSVLPQSRNGAKIVANVMIGDHDRSKVRASEPTAGCYPIKAPMPWHVPFCHHFHPLFARLIPQVCAAAVLYEMSTYTDMQGDVLAVLPTMLRLLEVEDPEWAGMRKAHAYVATAIRNLVLLNSQKTEIGLILYPPLHTWGSGLKTELNRPDEAIKAFPFPASFHPGLVCLSTTTNAALHPPLTHPRLHLPSPNPRRCSLVSSHFSMSCHLTPHQLTPGD